MIFTRGFRPGRGAIATVSCAAARPATHQAGLVWQIKHRLDVAAMRAAAARLLGKHDFTTFRSTVCQAASPVKTLDTLDIAEVETDAGPEVHFDVRARSFLHNQVRSFVGSLERVGTGSWMPRDMATALAARDRAACGPVCPPQGAVPCRGRLWGRPVRRVMSPREEDCFPRSYPQTVAPADGP